MPVCVVLDDLHWADAQSVALLKHLVRTVEQGALQVIATYRDSDLGKDHPLTAVLADLRSRGWRAAHRPARPRRRRGGPDHDRRRRARARARTAIELAAEIATETDGNPFFVGEILRGLSESGALMFDEAAGRWSIDSSARDRAARERARGDRAPRGAPRRGVARGR